MTLLFLSFVLLFLNASFQVALSDPSGPVNNLDAKPMGMTDIYVTWEKPTNPKSQLTGYQVYYARVSSTRLYKSTRLEPPITDPDQTSVKLHSLMPGTTYRITIVPTTVKGAGQKIFTDAATFDSPPMPSKPSFRFELMPVVDGKASVKLTWLPDYTSYPGKEFYVQYRKKGESNWMRSPTGTIDTMVETVDGLDPATIYEMLIVAKDEYHENASDVQEIETPAAPAELIVKPTPEKISEKPPQKVPEEQGGKHDSSPTITPSLSAFVICLTSFWLMVNIL